MKKTFVIKLDWCAQKFGFDYTETYAPVANMVTIRTLLSIVNQKNLFLIQMDVKTVSLMECLMKKYLWNNLKDIYKISPKFAD